MPSTTLDNTSVTGAVNFINNRMPTLPYSSPYAPHTIWKYAIIHLMPGRYCRTLGYSFWFNGLPGNGETFPIHLPRNVSIQGASALNTVFDMERPLQPPGGPFFMFGAALNSDGVNTFIDNVTMTGAVREEADAEPTIYASAVYLNGTVPGSYTEPTITNCFFYGNEVGITVFAAADSSITHQPTIMHNTFVWNQCGVWNGQSVLPPATAVGVSNLLVLNNIFDASPPNPDLAVGCPTPTTFQTFRAYMTSDFEGVHSADMTVQGSGNFNAFEQTGSLGKYDFGIAFIPGFPATVPRSPVVFPTPAASRNIARYTGGYISTTMRRGILFIRDLICNGAANGQFRPYTAAGFDLSPHDFRLAPAVADAVQSGMPPPPNALNPLVDNGWRGTFPMMMANGTRQLNKPPGYLVLGPSSADQATWPFSSCEEDCDGYGNQRDTDHFAYANNGVGSAGRFTDIGADELGELITAGIRYQTTTYTNELTNPPSGHMDNKYLWYLGPPAGVAGTPFNQSKPKYRHITSIGAPPSGNYAAPPWWSTWWTWPTPYYQPTIADITPHLIPDIHPWWSQAILVACNPVWNACSTPLYNPALFMNPTYGIINPPGSYLGNAGPVGTNFAWLDALYIPPGTTVWAYPQFGGPWGTNGADAFLAFDPWCVATDINFNKMETFPPTRTQAQPYTALRFTLEVPDSATWTPLPSPNPLGTSNIQSFLVFVVER